MNPKEYCKAINIRSGKVIVRKDDSVEEESEVQSETQMEKSKEVIP